MKHNRQQQGQTNKPKTTLTKNIIEIAHPTRNQTHE